MIDEYICKFYSVLVQLEVNENSNGEQIKVLYLN